MSPVKDNYVMGFTPFWWNRLKRRANLHHWWLDWKPIPPLGGSGGGCSSGNIFRENADPGLSDLANRPLDDLARLVQIEKPSGGFRLEEPFERAKPYLHASRRRKLLRNTGDDHLGAIVGG